MTLGLRFVDSETLQIRKEFIEFAVIEDLRGESLGQFILSRIEELGLDMKLCRGQGYDGAQVDFYQGPRLLFRANIRSPSTFTLSL
ncbi:hypothetical protein QYM36_008640 [Artemia franciscana]|uniref:Uncharacterized protein n=1 Tax=Artemia franciscana TaxID=6661 RepID=A0AA88LAD1_ARTSF|nr:hypothetical protein QYM36_008640 [Artemia franciscana]